MVEDQKKLWVGVDWATQHHDVCVVNDTGRIVSERSFEHSGDGLAALVQWLDDLSDKRPEQLAVAIEVPHGAVVETMLERGLAVHSINPKKLDRFRDRFSLPGAKDDRLDARVLATSLRTDSHAFRLLEPSAPLVIELREWSRIDDELKRERVGLGNRLREQIRRYFPQFLKLDVEVTSELFLALWEQIPTPRAAKNTQTKTVERVLRENRIRRLDAKAVLETLRQRSVTVAAGTTNAAIAHIQVLAKRIRLLNEQLRTAQRQLDRLTGELDDSRGQNGEQRDVEILTSLPGIGRIVLATLLAEATRPLADRNYQALRALAGVAPITQRSGKKHSVVMRKACHPRVRDAAYHWARVAAQRDPLSKARYASLRARGHSHGRALRSVADRLLAVACAMLKTGTSFQPEHKLVA